MPVTTCHMSHPAESPPFVTPSARNTGCHKCDVCYDRTLPYLDSQLVTLTQIEIISELNIKPGAQITLLSGAECIILLCTFPVCFYMENAYITILS